MTESTRGQDVGDWLEMDLHDGELDELGPIWLGSDDRGEPSPFTRLRRSRLGRFVLQRGRPRRCQSGA